MRILATLFLPLIVVAFTAQATQAQVRGGDFASKFEIVVDNCAGAGATLENGRVTIQQQGPVLSIKIPTLPDMKGKTGKRGKLRAEAKGEANAEGIRAEFGFNGRVRGKKLKAVLIAEFFKGDKPQCTQTWSVAGKPAAK
jgi:hypothetical protein